MRTGLVSSVASALGEDPANVVITGVTVLPAGRMLQGSSSSGSSGRVVPPAGRMLQGSSNSGSSGRVVVIFFVKASSKLNAGALSSAVAANATILAAAVTQGMQAVAVQYPDLSAVLSDAAADPSAIVSGVIYVPISHRPIAVPDNGASVGVEVGLGIGLLFTLGAAVFAGGYIYFDRQRRRSSAEAAALQLAGYGAGPQVERFNDSIAAHAAAAAPSGAASAAEVTEVTIIDTGDAVAAAGPSPGAAGTGASTALVAGSALSADAAGNCHSARSRASTRDGTHAAAAADAAQSLFIPQVTSAR